MPAHLVRSTCPYDCPDACGLLVEVEGGRAVSVRGDPEHPYSRGTLCAKMTRYERTVHSPDRLLHPLVREGAKGEGRFRRASWEEALALVADRLQEIRGRYGADAIGGLSSARCTNEENYAFQKFMRAAVGTNNVDHCARL